MLHLALAIVAALSAAAPALAQSNGTGGGYGGGSHGGGEGSAASARALATRVTAPGEVAARLREISGLCQTAGVYAVDCVAERIETLEKDMTGMAGYADVRQTLRDTAAGLRQVARNNRDPLQTRARLSESGGGQRSSRPLVAVAPQRKAAAAAQAIAILEQAETTLLRSSAAASARAAQYQRIAAALGSNKVLLRSA